MEHQALIVNDDIVPQLVTLDPSGWAAATALFGTSEIEWRLLESQWDEAQSATAALLHPRFGSPNETATILVRGLEGTDAEPVTGTAVFVGITSALEPAPMPGVLLDLARHLFGILVIQRRVQRADEAGEMQPDPQ